VDNLQLSTEVVGDVGMIRVEGEVDHLEAPTLETAASQLLSDGARSLVFDCSDIDYIDSAGLRVLVKAYNKAHGQGGTVTVRNPSAFTCELLQVVGLDTVLAIDGLPDPDGDPAR
jgi:anti-sigma B factor antagonist